MKRLTKVLAWMLPVAVFAGIWFPVLWKYHTSSEVDPGTVERLRTVPAAERLDELSRIRIGSPSSTFADVVPVADSILAGEPIVSSRGEFRLSARFSPDEVLAGPPRIALSMASFAVPEVMLGAYGKTRDPRYLQAAATYVRGWAEYERSVFLPRGLFWNDHAIAARALVLTELWLHYRAPENRAYDPAFAREVMELVERYGQLLGRHALYTYRSNHGTMQNLALMVLSLAFPELNHAAAWAETGYRRLIEQSRYYIGRDGVINEHSPGYQPFGMTLLGAALRCVTLMGRTVPEDLAARFERAKIYYTQLRRPDGTVPTIGDTDPSPTQLSVPHRLDSGGYGPLEPFAAAKPNPVTLHSNGGILVWWRGLDAWPAAGALSQLAVTWSNWPSRVHKHADEGSLVLWGGGREWITSSGYVPEHDGAGRQISEGWTGSNAPHLAGEAQGSARETRPLLHADAPKLRYVELERTRPDGFAVRRQILSAADGLWLVIDSFTDRQPRDVHTIWTAPPDLNTKSSGFAGGYRLEAPGETSSLDLAFAGSAGHEVTTHRGSRSPAAGWATTRGQVVTPAPALLVRQRSPSGWSAMAAMRSRTDAPAFGAAPQMNSWSGPERWSLRLDTRTGPIQVSRAGETITVVDAAGRYEAAAQPVTAAEHRAEVEAAYYRAAATAASPWFGDYVPYRLKATYLVLGLLVAQLLVIGLAMRIVPRASLPLSALAGIGWIAIGLWLNFVYFA